MRPVLKLWIRFWNAEPPLGVVLTAVTGACLIAAVIVLLKRLTAT